MKKFLLIILSLCMVLSLVTITNTHRVEAATVLKEQTGSVTIGKSEISLGKYTNISKVMKPIYIKKPSGKKTRVGFVRGDRYFTYDNFIIYVNKANKLCKTNISTKKTVELMDAKTYTVSKTYGATKLIVYNDKILKVVDVKDDTVTDLVGNPAVLFDGNIKTIAMDEEDIYYGKEINDKASLVKVNIADKKVSEIALAANESVYNVIFVGKTVYWTIEIQNEKVSTDCTYKIIKTNADQFQREDIISNARLINVISNEVFYEYRPFGNFDKGTEVRRYNMASKEDKLIITGKDLEFAASSYDIVKKGKGLKLTAISYYDQSEPEKAIYEVSAKNKVTLKTVICTLGKIDVLNKKATVKVGKNNKPAGNLINYKKYKIKTVVISKGIKTIPKNYFKKMNTVTKVYLPKTVKTVKKNAFKGINSKAKIYVKKSVLKKMQKTIKKSGIGKNVKVKAQ